MHTVSSLGKEKGEGEDEDFSGGHERLARDNKEDETRGMRLFLAGNEPFGSGSMYKSGLYGGWKPYILESFYYANEDTEKLIPFFGDFLLDSGAFTFMQSQKSAVDIDWLEYIDRYASFIVRNNVEKFFELDIDAIVGYDKVLELRRVLEQKVGRPCIPVWHKSRGLESFLRMCDEYSYAAIGGIVAKEIKPESYKCFPKMISEAHKRGCKLHGLGFTSTKWLPICHFDSVDSTSWTVGNRYGYIYRFVGKDIKQIKCPKGKRLADARKVAFINYSEWIKFQIWAVENL